MKKLECTLFADEQENVLMQALINAAKAYGINPQTDRPVSAEQIYAYLDGTPKTSLIVELVDELEELGYRIEKVI